MALSKVKVNIDRLFDKSLTDLVRGIRSHKDDEAQYIAECLEEIKVELKHPHLSLKTNAVSKLTYLHMHGYDISWAGFNIIEVMSSNKFTEKRMGYHSASQCFHKDTDVLMLTTNMIRKDLNSQSSNDTSIALSSLACFMSPDLSRDLYADIIRLLSSTKPYIRKKSVLILYKIFLRHPEALLSAFPRLREKLEDPDPGVQCAAVNVICELARKNPSNYLSLAPTFFKLMTTSSNNWMLIKIIKLFGALTPLEPRLGRKLIEPLTNLIHSTSAMSLLYECINTVIAVLISISSGLPNHAASIQLCVQKLRILIEDSDQNLKYLGLLAMSKILQTNPKAVQNHKDLIMTCLNDQDDSIRLRALDLLHGMVSNRNIMEIVKHLMDNMKKAEGTKYRDELMDKIIQICSQKDYKFIENFEWYISVLVELTQMEDCHHGNLISDQLLDVSIRVVAVRPFITRQMAVLIDNQQLIFGRIVLQTNLRMAGEFSSSAEVLFAAAWICGEFAEHLQEPISTLTSMFTGTLVMSLCAHIQAVYIQNALKLYSYIVTTKSVDNITPLTEKLSDNFREFLNSSDMEVQERASSGIRFLECFIKNLNFNGEDIDDNKNNIRCCFAGELNPVLPGAQLSVPIPDGLDLTAWINEPPSSNSVLDNYDFTSPSPTVEVEQKFKLVDHTSDPNYLKDVDTSPTPKDSPGRSSPAEESCATSLTCSIQIPGLASSETYLKKNKKDREKKTSKNKQNGRKPKLDDEQAVLDEVDVTNNFVVSTTMEAPEGFSVSDVSMGHPFNEDDPCVALARINLAELKDPTSGVDQSSSVEFNVIKDDEKIKKTSSRKKESTKNKSKCASEKVVDELLPNSPISSSIHKSGKKKSKRSKEKNCPKKLDIIEDLVDLKF